MPIISGGSGGGAVTPPVTLSGNGATLGPLLAIHNTDPGGSQAFVVQDATLNDMFAVSTSTDANTSDQVSVAAPLTVGLNAAYAAFDIAQFAGSAGGLVRILNNGGIVAVLPAADPHVVGQLYSVAGVVHVSAG